MCGVMPHRSNAEAIIATFVSIDLITVVSAVLQKR